MAGNQSNVGWFSKMRSERSRFFGSMPFSALRILFAPTPHHELVTNRTRLIRDAALASGRTCIACGGDAVGKVGRLPGVRPAPNDGHSAGPAAALETQRATAGYQGAPVNGAVVGA